MAATFAALETRLTQAVFSRLSNAVATIDDDFDGIQVTGIFDATYVNASVGPYGMASTQPVLTLPTASLPEEYMGRRCTIGEVDYKIVAHEPDGTGISRLILELA